MHIAAQLIGYPRIGPNRELKWALERAWSGRSTAADLATRVAELRQAHLDEQAELVGSAVDDFFLYDEVLETALMLGIHPQGLSDDPFELLTALARGTAQREAWEMTKWFDTNYHYVVPEVDRLPESLVPLPWREPLPDGGAVWPILGPYSLARLSKLSELHATDLARAAGRAIGEWARSQPSGFRLQLDEPCLGMRLDATDEALREVAYDALGNIGSDDPAAGDRAVRCRLGRDARGPWSPRPRRAGPARPCPGTHRHAGLGSPAGARGGRDGGPQRMAG